MIKKHKPFYLAKKASKNTKWNYNNAYYSFSFLINLRIVVRLIIKNPRAGSDKLCKKKIEKPNIKKATTDKLFF